MRAAIYMRVSSPGQEQNYSLPEQRADGLRYADGRNYTVREEHVVNDGWQRSYTLNRPGIHRLRELFRAKQIDVLVVPRYDRFSRSQLQQAVLIYEIEELLGGRVESAHPHEQYGRNAEGTLLRSIGAYRAEKEREDIRDRTQGGRRARARDGKIIAAAVPLYGYLWADPHEKHGKSRYVVDPETAPVVRRIYREAAAGVPIREILRRLEADGIPSPSHQRAGKPGGTWYPGPIRSILTNPAYAGEYVAYRWSRGFRKERDLLGNEREVHLQTLRPLDDPDRVVLAPEVCPPLVEKEIFDAVQTQLARNKAEATRNNKDPEAALLRSGFVVCGYCGAKLIVRQPKRLQTLHYRCPRRGWATSAMCPGGEVSISVRMLDGDVLFYLSYLFTHPSTVEEAVQRVRAAHSPDIEQAETHLQAIEGRLAQLHAEANNFAETIAVTTNAQARTFLAQRLDALYKDIEELTAEREAQTREVERWGDVEAKVATFEQWSAAMAEEVQQATYRWKRTAMALLGLKVQVWKTDHAPRYRIACTIGGEQSHFVVDEQGMAALRDGKRVLSDLNSL